MSINTSQKIRECRKEAGLSQERLAEKAGLYRAQICQYEKYGHVPSFNRFEDIMNACGYDVLIVKRGSK